VLEALGLDALPAEMAAVPLPGGGIARRMTSAREGPLELDVLIGRSESPDLQRRLTQAGVRPAGVWAYEAHRVAALRPRLGVDTDERTIPHEVGWIGGPGLGAVHLDKGCYRGQETVARVHNLGKPPRMLVLLHLDGSVERPATGDAVLANGRAVGRLGTVVEHVDLGPVALALLKRGTPADTALVTGGDAEVPAVIDADSLPPADEAGAGRLAVERLRGTAR
jgi:folate-binding protein YgfZ